MFIDIFHRKREFRGWTKIEKQIHGLELPPKNLKKVEKIYLFSFKFQIFVKIVF